MLEFKKLAPIGMARDDIGIGFPEKDRWWRIGTLLWNGSSAVAVLNAIPITVNSFGKQSVLIAKTDAEDAPYLQGTLAVTIKNGPVSYTQNCGRMESKQDGKGTTTYTFRIFAIPVICEKDRAGMHFKVMQDDET